METQTNISGLVSLKSIALKAIYRSKKSLSYYKYYMSFLIDGYKDLNLYVGTIIETKKLTMTSINTIDYPSDYLSYISIGIPYRGKLWTFTADDNLIISTTEDCAEETLDLTEGEGVSIDDNGSVSSYGVRGGKNYYYFVADNNKRRFVINGFDRTTVILRYISTGISASEETYVQRVYEEALLAWIFWKEAESNDETAEVKILRKERRFKEEMEKIKVLEGPSVEELMDMIYSTFYQGLKR